MHAAVRSLSVAGLLIVLVMASGCATIVKGSKQSVGIQTDPEGASCEFVREGQVIGSVSPTPGSVEVEKDKDNIEVTCKKKGFNPASDSISSSFQNWTLGNILIGGIIGAAIDAGSGAAMQYPPIVVLKLTPEKFANPEDREDFFEKWRAEVLQNSTKAKITAAKSCSKEQCDDIVKRIDRETEQALAGIDANRNLRKGSAGSAPDLAPQAVQTARVVPVVSTVAVQSASAEGGRWYPAKGDRWRYRLIDGKRPVGTVNVEVMESGDGRVRERITRDGSAEFSVEREVRPEFATDAFPNAVSLPGGYSLFELSPYFPPGSTLEIGKSFGQIPGEIHLPIAGKRNFAWSTRVMGKEKVRVPAGEFDAWRIDASASESLSFGRLTLTYRIWYSPAMRRAVKTLLLYDSRTETFNSSESLELAAFDKGQ
jgi:hypothetical protein